MNKEYFECSLSLSNSKVLFPIESCTKTWKKKSFFLSQFPRDVLLPKKAACGSHTRNNVGAVCQTDSLNWAHHGKSTQEIRGGPVGSSLLPLELPGSHFALQLIGTVLPRDPKPASLHRRRHRSFCNTLFSAAELNFQSELQGWVFPRRQIHRALVLCHLTVTTAASSWANSSES